MCSLVLALLLVGFGPAGAQNLQLRAGAWAARSSAGSDAAAASSSFEIGTVHSRLQPPAVSQPRLDGRATPELAGIHYRLWMTRGRADIGVGVGTLGHVLPAAAGLRSVVGAVPSVTMGMRYRVSEHHLLFADASGARGLGADPAATYLATKLGLEWKPAASTLGFEHGALGVQLDSGFRLSLKSRRGGPALYLRNTF